MLAIVLAIGLEFYDLRALVTVQVVIVGMEVEPVHVEEVKVLYENLSPVRIATDGDFGIGVNPWNLGQHGKFLS